MCDDFSAKEKARHDFFAQAIFERRKTQYRLFLFYLGVSGACASIALSLNNHKNSIFVLLVPILLLPAIYISWWYQRNQIFICDDIRKRIIGETVGWQDPLWKYSNDVIMIATPSVIVFIAWLVFREEIAASIKYDQFIIVIIILVVSTLISIICWIANCYRRRQNIKNNRKNKG